MHQGPEHLLREFFRIPVMKGDREERLQVNWGGGQTKLYSHLKTWGKTAPSSLEGETLPHKKIGNGDRAYLRGLGKARTYFAAKIFPQLSESGSTLRTGAELCGRDFTALTS